MIHLIAIAIPPTGNHRLMPICMGGRGRLVKSPKFRKWEKETGEDIRGRTDPIEDKDLFVRSTLRWPDKRKRDIDGPVKSLLDLVVRERFILDDSLISRLEVIRYKPDEHDLMPGTCDVFIQSMKDYNCPF